MSDRYTMHHVTMHDVREIAPGLFFGADVTKHHAAPIGRIFKKENRGFRGYATHWHTDKRGACFRVEVWDYPSGERVRKLYNTVSGANAGLIRLALSRHYRTLHLA